MSPNGSAARVRLPVAAGVLLAVVMLATLPAPTLARTHFSPGLQEGTIQIASVIGDIAVAVVRLLIGAGAALFVVGVARGAFDGMLASTLGTPGGVSVGLIRLVGITGAFLLLLVSYGLSRAFVDLLIAQFVDSGALTTPVPGDSPIYVPQGASQLGYLAGVIGEALRLVLFLIGAWFMVAILVALINGEIAVATDAPGAMARLVERLVTSLILMLIGATTPALSRDLAVAVEGGVVVASAGQAIQLYGVVLTIIVNILLAVFVAVLVVSVVASGFAAHMGSVLGFPHSLGSGIARVLTAFAIGLVGFGVINLANRLLITLVK